MIRKVLDYLDRRNEDRAWRISQAAAIVTLFAYFLAVYPFHRVVLTIPIAALFIYRLLRTPRT